MTWMNFDTPKPEKKPLDVCHGCAEMAIAWALKNAPKDVRKRHPDFEYDA